MFSFNRDYDSSNSIVSCPNCKNELLKINSIIYDNLNKDYKISYKCHTYNDSIMNINLKKLLMLHNKKYTASEYLSYCPYHEFNTAPYYCAECKENLCKDCYKEHLLYEQNNEHFNNHYNSKKNCKIHNDNKYISYCNECKKNVCIKCIKEQHFNHNDNWKMIDDDFYIKYNMNINKKLKTMNEFINKNIFNIDKLIDEATKLKQYINECYDNYLNMYLPLINLYKLYLYKSLNYYSNDINEIITNFDFDYICQYELNKPGINFSNNDNDINTNIYDNTLTKLNKEIKIIEESLNIYNKGINFIFSKINFRFNDDNKKSIKLDNPFITTNNKKNYIKCIKELSNHKDEIYSLIKLSNGNFASGSGDGLVLIWDSYLLDLSLTIHAHKGIVNCLCECDFKDNKNILLTGGNDNYIQFWDIKDDYNCVKKLMLNGPIINLFYISKEIFVSFTGNEIMMWSIKKYNVLYKVSINDIYILEYLSDNIFASGMEDNSLMIFNIFDIKMTHKKLLIGNDDIISCIKKINQKYIATGNYEGNLIIWDLSKMELYFQIKQAHLYKITCIIQLNNGLFVTCSSDKNIKIWDLHKRICITCFSEAHQKAIKGVIQLNNGEIVSAGNDSIIKIWN